MPADSQTMSNPTSILVVEDDHEVRKALTRLLAEEYDVLQQAADAKHALELLAAHPVDVVVSDYDMPGMSGIELLQQVRIRWPDTLRVLRTGRADVHLAARALNEGAAHRFLLKPWTRFDLVGILQMAAHSRRANAAR